MLVTDDVVTAIEELEPLAPLHNPAHVEGIKAAWERFPDVPQVAVFDTAFHHAMPAHSYTYAVPRSWREEHRRRVHGTSYAHVTRRAAAVLGQRVENVNLVVLHLGNGASAAAISGGRSMDTSMGLTTLEGLGYPLRRHRPWPFMVRAGMSADDVDAALNRASGLKGLSEPTTSVRWTRSSPRTTPTKPCVRRGRIPAAQVRRGVCGGARPAGRPGVHGGDRRARARLRAAVCHGLGILGVELDDEANVASGGGERRISTDASAVAVLVVPTNEELEIAQVAALVEDGQLTARTRRPAGRGPACGRRG